METIIAISSEDIQAVNDFAYKKNRGLMVDSKKVVELYNKIMYPKVARPTSCGGCIKNYIQQMEVKVNQWKKALELKKEEEAPAEPILSTVEPSKEAEVNNVPQKENKPKTKGVSKKTK